MLDAMIEPFKSYYNELPENTLYCVGSSTVFSFVASVILARGSPLQIYQSTVSDFRHALFASGCAAAASLIHAFMTPIFNRFFGDDDQNKVQREFITFVVDVSLLKLSILSISSDIGEVAVGIRFLSLNLLKSLAYNILYGIAPIAYRTQYCHNLGLVTDPNSSSTYLVL